MKGGLANRRQDTKCPFPAKAVGFLGFVTKSSMNIQSQSRKNEQFRKFYTMLSL